MSIESEMKTIVEGIKLPRDRSSRRWRLALVGAALFGAWAFTGFMNPETLLRFGVIHAACVDFAKEKNVFPSSGNRIWAANLRMRNGNWVVDLIAQEYPDKPELDARTCVVNSNTIRIVSMLESG